MYAGRVVYCPLASHGVYADGQTDGRTDERQTVYIMLSANRGQRNNSVLDNLRTATEK